MPPKISTLIGGLRIAMQALGAKMGVTLRIEGDQAYTTGSEIIIPTLPPDDHKAAVLARGYVDHESAHVRHSDFERNMGTWGELIEEVYIEKKQCEDFPGCAINLRDMVGILKHEDGSFRGTKSQPMSLLTSWLVCRGRADVLGQPLGDFASEMETWSRQSFGDPFCDQFAACVARVGSCNTLDDCVNLGNEIETLITNPPPPRQKDKRPESGKNNQSADSGNSDNRSPGGSESKGTSADSPRTSAGKQSDNLAGLRTADVGKATQKVDLGKIVAQMLGKEHTKGERTGNLEDIPDTHHPSVGAGSGTGDQRRIEGEMGFDDARRKTSRMRSQLAGLLQAVRLQQSNAKRAGHRIDSRSVYRVACRTPDTRIFEARRDKQDDNTAIVLLTDRSGSMNPEKMSVALQATFVTAEALELLPGVTCAVGAFPWGRDLAELKPFGAKPRAGFFNIGSSGGTPMAEALLWAGMLLTHRPERRKIVIPMTDGSPDDIGKTRKAVERLKECGIEVYGIGILDTSILNWLRESSVIKQIEELPAALIGLLKEALITRRKVA
ncbi:VWA domain-containing protein [Geobacter benzoatilyticus]|uniref:VWA domain-containing protein n=1 Tax=Geobacter benzoatilyticus TaxID=2815309 RepID=A0ABX7Q2X6_9BACT|nr:VWA domain-containing protein [Geobacter benzoatilyticus]QSV45455.1 VWA domain-containing protein [Geobacter benzoatilyticus]